MTAEQEALRLADALEMQAKTMRLAGQNDSIPLEHDTAAAMIRKLVAEREADRAAMRSALEAMEHTVAWNDDEISPSFVVDCRAAITHLRQRLEGTT